MDEILTQRRIRSSAILATFCLLQAHPLRRNMSAIRTASRRVCLAPSAFRQAPRASFAVAPRVVVQHTRGPTSGATASLGLSCLLLALPAAAALSAPAESVEPATKIAFSTSLDNLPLLGTGCRYKVDQRPTWPWRRAIYGQSLYTLSLDPALLRNPHSISLSMAFVVVVSVI